MSVASPPDLVRALVSLCEDSLFAITASGRLDLEVLQNLRRRRLSGGYADQSAAGMINWDAWLIALSSAIAPIAPPHWMPMAEVVEELSLEHGARGVRALFTTKPSDREIERVRKLGALAVRALGAVLSAAGPFTQDHRLLRKTLIASLGLPAEDERQLDQEAPPVAEALDIKSDKETKVLRAIVRGAFFAGMGDGLDPREEQAVLAIARKSGLTTDEVNEAHAAARDRLESSKDFGLACVDAIRFVLSDDSTEGDALAIAAARLTLPIVFRREALMAINLQSPVTLGQKHRVERKQRSAVLGLAWVAALRSDPPTTRRAELAARHDRVGADLSAPEEAAAVRNTIDRFVESELAAMLAPPQG